MDTFDIAADLHPGTTLLEASAGTGKTWTIAALVAKQVASGEVRLDEMLVVTFTRAASQELRERVRRQLDEAVQLLADPALRDPDNRLHAWLLDATADEVARRLDRLTAALVSFDAATIATIHQFCQLVLRSLGVAGDTDAAATLVEDLEQLTTETVDDLYLARFGQEEKPPWTRAAALELARTVVGDPRAVVEPAAALTASPDSAAAMRVRFATEVLEEVERRKRRLGILSYDDLLSQLADALEDTTAAARRRMQHRWKFVLIDEFQDTDPVQWQVFQRAFSETTTMVLIGDPKQAIYAFRGGDIVTYLQASETATTVQTLGVNWRSDGPLLDSVHAVLRGARLGDERIVVHPVQAHRTSSRLQGAGAPFRLRVVRRAELGKGPRSKPPVALWRDHVITDTAHDVRRLIESRPTFDGRELRPGDIAVLAARRNELDAVQHALAQVGVPSVVNAGGSVFHTPAAGEWVALLEALEQPHRADRVRAAALTSFFGHTAASLDAGGDDLTDRLADRVRQLADVFTERGVAAVVEVAAAEGLTARVLARVGGERTLTDLRHIGESLLRVSTEERLGLVGLLAWLREQVADDKLEVASERTRRLDSDAEAVQLVTIHGSKGLQYPVVYLPTLWNRYTGREPVVPLYHDDDGQRCRDVGGPSAFRREAVARHWREDAGESLRLLYVAMTRAQSQVVAWYAAAERNTPDSPLHRVLFGRRPGMAPVPDSQALVDEDRLTTILAAWQDAGGPSVELATLVPPDPTPLQRSTEDLAVRAFTRSVDTAWRRTSYSSLSAASASHAAAASLSEPEDVPDEDSTVSAEDLGDAAAATALPAAASVPSPMATLPVGATFGSLVHAVLEHADPAADDFRGELLRLIDEQLVWWPVELDPDELADALVAVCSSPLGPLAADRTLLSLGLPDRLRELDFEVPLAGGDTAAPATDVRLGDLAPLLRRHLPDGDAVRVYADALDADPDLAAQSLRGYLTGSIDVVLRLDVDGAQRFLTVDYKTNWLGPVDQPLTAHDYRPEMLDEAMAHSDYPLQALLYTVVLHRFLRWRLPAYDPATHLGGVLYLYLRGMCGPDTPVVDGMPCGVFSWRPPVALVEELSDLLDGVRAGVTVP
ncbi:UvrD-helicase domain-containing protein [Nocardioides ganghwensis]|uniref:RecBCD enzyme subunit RecB n=1 Tax=Nocardioides ganghwensis TaxID=252230 RepID=A0A4Q2S8P8_9ACTN|nr:UvrD-helicase domain-containing protein [Nocardioides ganghwensis]MBD3947586.1 UvrD-helicase domain-containing protein [Nocardioides ganghwensis]RYB99395.1 exodeoxyribonuclease V subunit beta [Nocardioides ganghwensis]